MKDLSEFLSFTEVKSEKKDWQLPHLSRFHKAFLVAMLGAVFLSSCGVIDSRAKSIVESAGVPPAVANDPDLLWYAANGATAEELRDYANTILMKRSVELQNAQATQQAQQEAQEEAQQEQEPEPTVESTLSPEEELTLNKEYGGVFSFKTEFDVSGNIEVTDQSFIRRVKEALQEAGENNDRVYVAVNDIGTASNENPNGIFRIFMDSTVDSYKAVNGVYYIYPGDTVYISTDIKALEEFLTANGWQFDVFGLP